MATVAVIGKGGVGKTTTAVALADALAHGHGYRVLLVDLDTQASATSWLAPDLVDLPESDLARGGVAGVLLDEVDVPSAVRPLTGRLDLLPGSYILSGVEQRLAGVHRRAELQLRDRLVAQAVRWDVVVIDTPRALDSRLSFNALEAADRFVLALNLEASNIDALRGQLQLLAEFDPPRPLGLVATRVDRRTYGGRVGVDQLAAAGHTVLGAVPISTRFAGAWAARELPSRAVPDDRAADAYRAIAQTLARTMKETR